MNMNIFSTEVSTKQELDPRDFYTIEGDATLSLHKDFKNALISNQPFNGWNPGDPLPDFSTAFPEVTSLHNTFGFPSCSSLKELDLSKWDTSNVTDMISMFEGCSSLKELDISNFDTSNVTYRGVCSMAVNI